MDEHGSIAPQVLVLLIFIAALLWAAVPYVSTAMLQCSGAIKNYTTCKQLETEVQKVIDKLEADRTPDADWHGDRVQEYVKSQGKAVKIRLTDISSKINPNYIRKKMLDQTRLKTLLRPNTTVELLQQYRFDNGPITTLSQCTQFFRKEALPYLTCSSWANINTTDEFMLQKIFLTVTDSTTDAEEFHKKIQDALENQILCDEEGIFIYFGEYVYKVWPIINATPWFNVNFVDPFILRALIEYPEYGIADAPQKADHLVALREETELSVLDVAAILGIGTNHALMHYLGVTTSFWEISVQINNLTYKVTVARVPENTHSYILGEVIARHRYVIVERSYEP
jgi:hypothetical protein